MNITINSNCVASYELVQEGISKALEELGYIEKDMFIVHANPITTEPYTTGFFFKKKYTKWTWQPVGTMSLGGISDGRFELKVRYFVGSPLREVMTNVAKILSSRLDGYDYSLHMNFITTTSMKPFSTDNEPRYYYYG